MRRKGRVDIIIREAGGFVGDDVEGRDIERHGEHPLVAKLHRQVWSLGGRDVGAFVPAAA